MLDAGGEEAEAESENRPGDEDRPAPGGCEASEPAYRAQLAHPSHPTLRPDWPAPRSDV